MPIGTGIFPLVRSRADRRRIEAFMRALGQAARGPGRVYLTGGASAVLFGWRTMTLDVDVQARPEPDGFFESLPALKERLDLNIESVSPFDFIPEPPGWERRSRFIATHGAVGFFHLDFHAQALSKIERGHDRDRADVASMIDARLVEKERLWRLFLEIEPRLIRYPAIDPPSFQAKVRAWTE